MTATRLSPCGANRLLYIKPEAALAEALRANGLPGLLREAIALGKSGHLKRAGHCPPGQQCVRDRRLGDCLLQAKKEWASPALGHDGPANNVLSRFNQMRAGQLYFQARRS